MSEGANAAINNTEALMRKASAERPRRGAAYPSSVPAKIASVICSAEGERLVIEVLTITPMAVRSPVME
jgi:hypothetical protein